MRSGESRRSREAHHRPGPHDGPSRQRRRTDQPFADQPQPDRGSPTGVHRRVPAHGGRQGTDRRPREVPRPARCGRGRLALARSPASRSTPRPAGRTSRRRSRPCRITDPDARAASQRFVFAGAFEAELDRQGRVLVPAYLREAIGLAGEAVVVGSRDHAEIWAPGRWDEYQPGARRPASAGRGLRRARDLAPPHALPGSARDPIVLDGGEMKEGHMPVLAEEVIEMLAPAPGSLQIDATVGGGGHTERILEATNPDGRLLGLDADGAAIARVADRLGPLRRPPGRSARRTSASSATVAPEAGLRRRRRLPLRPRPLELPARRHGPRLRLPRRRPARHALRHRARRPGRGAARDPRCRRADRAVPSLRRGAQGRPDRPRHRRRPQDRTGRRPPRNWPRSSSASRRRTRASRAGPTRPRASSRRCGSRSTRSSRRSRPASPPRSTCCGPAAGSWSSATTRSRTASSSASSPPSGAAASARPSCRSASAARTRACVS